MLRIEGYSRAEILAFPSTAIDDLVLNGQPVVLQIGTATVLGAFALSDGAIHIELAQIDGGGEGALPLLASTAKALARQRGCARVEWTVHAVDCAKPNLKLRRVLERRGFVIESAGDCRAYRLTETLDGS